MICKPFRANAFIGLVSVLALPIAAGHASGVDTNAPKVTGEYMEARSASVYAGGCHYNGEVTTEGREAMLAWKFDAGKINGVSIAGLGAVALITGNDNLADTGTVRSSVLLIDERATPAQRDALVALLKARIGTSLGTVSAVKSVPVRFASETNHLSMTAGQATLQAAKYPCSHCIMPAQTWYTPFSPVQNVMVAQGETTGFNDKTLGVAWLQSASDNVFFGTFSL